MTENIEKKKSKDKEYNEPHAYIHIPPEETGKKFQRTIVPVSTIKNFDFNEYVSNTKVFKNKIFKFKNPEGKKLKCFVLHASGK